MPVLDSVYVRDAGPRLDASSCSFCGHARETADGGDSWRVLFDDEAFVAVPSIGSLVPGWLLVVPRDHAVNLASMGPKRVAAMWSFVEGFADRWATEFGRLVVFEHGPAAEGRPAGCGVDHAHLHVVPCGDIDLLAAARRRLKDLDWAPVSDLSALVPAVSNGLDYLYMKRDEEEVAAVGPAIPSQALRQVLAAELGSPESFNWREHPNLDVVRATIARAARL
jgi:diadenosine tetraphosphate (Ap4A) HIT family hydrolase